MGVLTDACLAEPAKHGVRHIACLTIGAFKLAVAGLNFVKAAGLSLTTPAHTPIRLQRDPDAGAGEILFRVHGSGAAKAPQSGQHRGLS